MAAILPGGVRVGIEVTELVDDAMRAKHARRREAERALGLDPQEAFLTEHRAFLTVREAAATARKEGRDPAAAFEETLRARHPAPDRVGHNVFADWNDERLTRELERIIRTKDGKLGVADQTGYSEILLAIFTDEAAITAEAMVRAAANVAYRPTNIGRVALVAGYDPATGEWPVIVW